MLLMSFVLSGAGPTLKATISVADKSGEAKPTDEMSFVFEAGGLTSEQFATVWCFPADLTSGFCGTQGLLFSFSLVEQDPAKFITAFEPIVGIADAADPFAGIDSRKNPFTVTTKEAMFDTDITWTFTATAV